MHLLKEVEPLPCLVLVIYEGLLTATRTPSKSVLESAQGLKGQEEEEEEEAKEAGNWRKNGKSERKRT
jgi:ABC-type multidrug transport system ATPase subunit